MTTEAWLTALSVGAVLWFLVAALLRSRQRVRILEDQLRTVQRPAKPPPSHQPAVAPQIDELQQRQSELRLINDINDILVGELLPSEAMEALCTLLKERFSLVLVSVYLLDHKIGLRLVAYCGEGIPEDHTHLAIDSQGLVESDGLIATAVRTSQTVYAPDVAEFAGYLEGHPKVRSEYTVPLMAGGRLIGVLNFESQHLDGFDPSRRQLLDRVARQGSLAIQRAQILQRLQESEARYSRATAAGKVGMWDWDLDSDQFYLDPTVLATFGLQADEVDPSLDFWKPLFPDEDRRLIEAAKRACVRGETTSYILEHRIYHRSGAIRWLMARGEPIAKPDGRIYRLMGTATDITERKAYEEALIEAKEAAEAASLAKSDFLARMSHELRTPLHGVIGSASLLSSMSLEEEPASLVDTIQHSARVLLSTINDVLEISKIEAGHFELEREAFSILDCIDSSFRVVEGAAREKGLELERELTQDVPEHIVGDFIRLRQILINLIHNAIKFTQTGSVRLSVSTVDDDAAPLGLQFAVRDTGPGIPEDQQTKLFDPFTQGDTSATRRHDGTGLGLAICHHLVRMMGGHIWIESTVGVGSTFFFTLEVEPSRGDLAPRVASSVTTPMLRPILRSDRPLRVLVAEDNPVNQKVTEMQLRSLGCSVRVTADGLATLEAYSQEAFDLVFMDCQMPELDGFDTTLQIRSQERETAHHLPIVGLTAYATASDRERCLACGMDDFLSKPVTVEDLRMLLQRRFLVAEDSNGSVDVTPPFESQPPPISVLPELPIVDPQIFGRLRELSDACGEDVLGKATALFSRDAPRHVKNLRRSFSAGETQKLTVTAHSLKGSSEIIGALRLGSICREVETAGRSGDISGLGPWVEAAEAILEETLETLTRLSGDSRVPSRPGRPT